MAIGKIGGMFVLAVSVAGMMPVRAHADLIGATLGWQYYDGGGIGGTFIEPTGDGHLPVFNIDADDTTITFDFPVDEAPGPWSSSPLSLSPTIFTGFGVSNLSFTANRIQIDWENLAFTTPMVVVLDVDDPPGAPSAPEAGTSGLMGLSLLTVGFVGRRKLKLL